MPQRLQSLSRPELFRRLARGTLLMRVAPFCVRISSPLPQIHRLIDKLYGDYPLASDADYRDFDLQLRHTNVLRRWVRPSATFGGDGESPFAPMPAASSFPLFEWGLNWRVATTAHQFLMLHAAVVARNGVTVVMPALPGSGKSTLAAALMSRGWRLLSDEFGLVRPGTTAVVPFPRPIPLKNESVPLMARFAPDAVIGPTFYGTRKGDVAHMKPSRSSIDAADEPATVTHIVFPHYEKGAASAVHPIAKALAFLRVSSNSFNYQVLGLDGFRTVGDLIEQSACMSFVYSDLDDAVRVFSELAVGAGALQASTIEEADAARVSESR